MKMTLLTLVCFAALLISTSWAELNLDEPTDRRPLVPVRPPAENVIPPKSDQPATGSHVVINLVDGSRILGQPQFDKLPIKTGLGDISVPLEKIASIQWKKGDTNAEVKLKNGDKISGQVLVASVKMSTCIGVLTLKVADMTSLAVEPDAPAAPKS